MHKKKPYFARFLALLLSTTTVFGSVPVSASSVAGSSVLESADSSGDTQNPDGSDSSGDTQNPDGSNSSGDTRNPDGSDSSGDTQNPDSSDSSGDAQNPDNSDSSGDTQNPDSSDKDDNEEKPEVSYSKIHFITLPYNSDAILLKQVVGVFKCPAQVSILADNHLRRVLLAVLDEVDFTLSQRVELLLTAGVHKEHEFLIAYQFCLAANEVLLHEIQIQLNVRAQNIIADNESVALSLAHHRVCHILSPS